MEYLWMILAALGAGIGTGLAGLSAATVMVPVLIVLCSSFSGETGAYQATAIALASDILGSAVTTAIYAKNKKIDLKRGWIMMVCILLMCIVGSCVAWLVGNVVLGGFTLFLTFFIGIRFLAKPDTSKKNLAESGSYLGVKEIIISLFFGLTIGFGTGFVGTGGGMMMLIVFTVFLKMELKTAVGTSTFIMTFTALIASISHICINPAIVLERWDALLICSSVTTVASLVSAKFANRVNNRTVGLLTGAVLTVLGAAMLILNYWSFLSQYELFVQTLTCLGRFLLFIVICILVLVPIYLFVRIPKFIFRKLLHMVAFSCVTLMIVNAESWHAATLTSIVIAVIIFPVLMILEHEPWYSNLFVEKSKGEVKRSLLMLFLMFAVLIAISWGVFDRPYACAAAILMWGFGDASAALVGIPFGKHKVTWQISDGKKSWEGTIAMMIVSFTVGFLYLGFSNAFSWWMAGLVALIASIVGSFTELVSKSEIDTITVPTAVLAVLLLF